MAQEKYKICLVYLGVLKYMWGHIKRAQEASEKALHVQSENNLSNKVNNNSIVFKSKG